MGLHHRKLMTQQEACLDYCSTHYCSSESDCNNCINGWCSSPPKDYLSLPPPPPPFLLDKYDDANHHGKHTKISTPLIITFAVLATAFFALCCYAIYAKFFSSRNRSTRQQPQRQETHDEFVDEEHGPMVDHPIWYIRTPGLHQSIINAITVCKYKRGEGLIEGTECSVCLSEFQEDETLRLLPKCNHAFHLHCIDTWLRSHTNCPMCRAPIVTNPATARIPSMEPSVVDASSLEGAQMENLENSHGIEGNSGAELRNGSEEEEEEEVEGGGRRVCENEGSVSEVATNMMQPRRSVSLDSSSAAKISTALATVVVSVEESNRNSKRQIGEANELVVSKRVAAKGSSSSSLSSSFRARYLQSAPDSMKRSRSFNGKHLLSWYSRSQKKPNAPLRSF